MGFVSYMMVILLTLQMFLERGFEGRDSSSMLELRMAPRHKRSKRWVLISCELRLFVLVCSFQFLAIEVDGSLNQKDF